MVTAELSEGIGFVGVYSSDKSQSNRRNQGEQEHISLENRHASVVYRVKLRTREMEPWAMPSMHPILCQQEAQPLQAEDAIVPVKIVQLVMARTVIMWSSGY